MRVRTRALGTHASVSKTRAMVSKNWDRVAAEEEARIEEEDSALARQSAAALGLDRGAPSGVAEHEERSKRDALRAAKAKWRAREDDALAAKHVVENETGVTRVITQADLVDSAAGTIPGTDRRPRTLASPDTDLPTSMKTKAIHLKDCRDCVYVLDDSVKTAKLFVESCENVTVTVKCLVITQHLEMWNSKACRLRLDAPVATVQVDSCEDCRLFLRGKKHLGAVLHATCSGVLEVHWDEPRDRARDDLETGPATETVTVDLLANERALARTAPTNVKPAAPTAVRETSQFITRLVDGALATEPVIRDADEYPTTAREILMDAARTTTAVDVDALNAARVEKRKTSGNAAFKEGDYPQAVAHYTSCLALDPTFHVALANRSACFLKLGEHEKALADANACVAADPAFVKGRFRVGVALHALGRYAEAAAALAEAERLDPKNQQIRDALQMASFKARKQAAP